MQIPSEKLLADWTLEASEYLEESGRTVFPTEIQDVLFERDARRCGSCRTVKVLGDFPRNRSGRKGIHHSCKDCMRKRCASSHIKNRDSRLEYKRTFYEENRERVLERNRDYHLRHPWTRALGEGYLKADRAGLPAERITEAQLLEYWAGEGINPNECFYTGIELVPFVNRSLDHKIALSDPDSPGHVLENLVPADNGANAAKRDRRPIQYVIETASIRPTKKEMISA